MAKAYSLYEEAQIILAGIRLFKHRERRLPSLKELAEFTHFNTESAHHLCNRLETLGAVERIHGAFDERICLKNVLEAEKLREATDSPNLDKEIKKQKEDHENAIKEVEKKFSDNYGKKEKEDLFAKIEEKIKKGGKEDKKSPLDALFGNDSNEK